jgi:hypothetical protein
MQADGKVLTYAQGQVVPDMLKGEDDLPGRRGGKKIRPNSVWYCSLATQPVEVAPRESAADEPSGGARLSPPCTTRVVAMKPSGPCARRITAPR